MNSIEIEIKTLTEHKKKLEIQLAIESEILRVTHSVKGMNRINEGQKLLIECTSFIEHLETVKHLAIVSGEYYKDNFYTNN